jgi:DNA-directed RNA polymerase specialized sigma24 family protein
VNAIRSLKRDWILTEAAFQKLLACLDSDRDRAGAAYERLRTKLLIYFEHRGSAAPEDLADETLNRFARRLEEGLEVPSAEAHSYVYAIARNVLREMWKQPEPAEPLDTLPESRQPAHDPRVPARPDPELRLGCLTKCLEKLPADVRELVMRYHTGEGRERIDGRKALSDRIGVPLNALRIRVHRIRNDLEACMKSCLERATRVK